MINVVCVKNGPLYGPEYVNILFDMVHRNLGPDTKFKFICFTDDAKGIDEHIQIREIPENLEGWWAKLYLFKSGLFPDGEQIFYIDLSTVIVSGLDKIFEYRGDFAILRDFYRFGGLQSAFMSWIAGKYSFIWDEYKEDGYPSFEGGDQEWIERCFWGFKAPDIWQGLYPGDFVSFKAHCQNGIPKGAKVVKFHGLPKPHEIHDGWVPNIWKVGGGSSLEFMVEANTKLDKLKENIAYALNEGVPVLDAPAPEHDRHAVIVGGGPSINGFVDEIRMRADNGQDIVALNNSWKWLDKRGISTDYHAMVDARPENAEFVPPSGHSVMRLYATQCDHRVITLSKGENTLLWNSYIDALADHFQERNMFWVGSGSSIGIRSIFLLYTLGYRHFHLYGYDSSYVQEEGHAYEQKLNNGEKTIKVNVHGREFVAAPWMVTQAQDFLETMECLTAKGCRFTIHGDGLLPYMAQRCLTEKTIEGDMMVIDGVYWPALDEQCHFSTYRQMNDVEEIMKLVPKKGTAVQAGGNVGLWPKRMAAQFKSVYTFEPDDLNFRCMEKNITENNIFKFNAALGERSGTVGMLRDEKNTGAHQIYGAGDIPEMTIDSLNLSECDLIQLDIEGYELFALSGAKETISRFRPVIVVEFKEKLMEDYQIKPNELGNFLAKWGYEIQGKINRDLIFTTKWENEHGSR